ncbi:MAG: sulfurase [Marinosulfonomonas sp.]|nr:MAG: sulfurase [Marinosulfonomonas sp.]
MPALLPTAFTGRITWLGVNKDRTETLRNIAVDEMALTFAGCSGESRAGLTRPSCSRVVGQYPRDTEIRNTRQICIVSAEELAVIAANMGIEAVDPAWLSTSIVVEGIPDFTTVPPASRLIACNGTAITVDMENRPCNLPAPVINEDMPDKGRAFKLASKGLRGVAGWIEREGMLRVGDEIRLHIPDQPVWPHLDQARGI